MIAPHASDESTRWLTAKDLRVLLVDGDSGVRESIAEAIEDRFKVLTASSGPEALRIVEAEHPEIVLSDQRMSPMSGLELLAKVAALRPNTRRLLYTGYADIETVIDGLNRDILQTTLNATSALTRKNTGLPACG